MASTHLLRVLDTRTDTEYEIPVQDNFINAKDISRITVPDADDPNITRKLLVLDKGFETTACMTSKITHM